MERSIGECRVQTHWDSEICESQIAAAWGHALMKGSDSWGEMFTDCRCVLVGESLDTITGMQFGGRFSGGEVVCSRTKRRAISARDEDPFEEFLISLQGLAVFIV
eukprot:gnl/MRDRNA2_/MRDRNA2_287970_c0_seq1.p1 gnl/MRDRNA2_/MRDRNA2_287970_c0~~gnl/MRDRNA2_/MRDRNA2_287970_c0_seq1.p1  ORF type:complete len:105 (+),score=20.54 gnl/MRDRNA2_/MRDRNA2_287970_c0_seq1:410-724(+)